MPAPNRLPYSSNVSGCRSGCSSNASRQLRRKVLLGWLVISTSSSQDATPSRRHSSCTTSGPLIAPTQHPGNLRFGETDPHLTDARLPIFRLSGGKSKTISPADSAKW